MPDDSSPIVNIEGRLVTLGPVTRDLVPLMTRWMNDLGLQHRLGLPRLGPLTLEAEEGWYDSLRAPANEATFLIRDRETGTPIGTTSLHEIDHRSRSAMFGIIIGEPSQRGRGFGTEAASLMLDFGFTVLGLHSIGLGVAEFNLAGRKAYAKAGFKECGRWRQRIWLAGRMWDEIHMDCLASEFTSPVLANTFRPDDGAESLVS